MYRLAKGKQELLLRFSSGTKQGLEEQAEICRLLMGKDINFEKIAAMDSLILLHNKLGAIVVQVDRHPSLVLNVTAVIPNERWLTIKSL
ncbi:hypothetical protein D1B31_06590 [Neobacillus notoginsengisoli]|uniref:Uncharacterized protein n=1 Tax=Neobacillus notoginsengisoli TaxID=1578198 RepID=A0A417YXF6_9BACI|nr:hypothetical protein [Neobacillus notoginsengisoli]RHW42283.1 hypothetical protein D1B31_06590 [Neobacillus notoginsengisoli]